MHPPHDVALARLTGAQLAAWRCVRDAARARLPNARARVSSILSSVGCPLELADAALKCIRRHARVVVHFHPDRVGPRPITVAEALLEDGQYRSQFETGLSSGSLTGFPGGARDKWEETLFGGAYHGSGASMADRPKYGALELLRFPDGPWPRFGSCYLVLHPEVSWRTSFTFPGSEQPDAVERLGTIDTIECVMAPLLAEIASGAGARVAWSPYAAPTLGVENLTVSGLLKRVSRELPSPRPSSGAAGRVLDSGVEAQVHGPIDMARDVDRIVADPAFDGTPTGSCLEALCRKHTIPLEWHGGFRLAAEDVPEEFRGPAVRRLAKRIARDGVVDAAAIGAAQRSLRLHPEGWRQWGSHAEVVQHLKQLWHVLVHCGEPAVDRNEGAA